MSIEPRSPRGSLLPADAVAAAAPLAIDDPFAIRRADPAVLGPALRASRARTTALFACYERTFGAAAMAVPCSAQVNPPLWELGHIAWFQEYWIARNSRILLGIDAASDAPRTPSLRADADRHYDSSRVQHAARWHLPLADVAATRDYLARTLDRTVQIVAGLPLPADPLRSPAYFAWLALAHEDMHGEAAVYMANALAVDLESCRALVPQRPARPTRADTRCIAIPPGLRETGSGSAECGFDNEMPAQRAWLQGYAIDPAPVSNAAFADFIAAGGYDRQDHWTPAGWHWRQQCSPGWPRFWRRSGRGWEQRWFGAWETIDDRAPASNVSAHEADAWCRWAGRRLPTEREWECAAVAHGSPGAAPGGGPFAWGAVWEWVADDFGPYPGFVAHPYRDYSQPWFGSRRCLRGASFATQARMRHPRYRNFFPPERNDIFAGFRSCAPRDAAN